MDHPIRADGVDTPTNGSDLNAPNFTDMRVKEHLLKSRDPAPDAAYSDEPDEGDGTEDLGARLARFKPTIEQQMRQHWNASDIGKGFIDPDQAFDEVRRYTFTPVRDRPSLAEFGKRLVEISISDQPLNDQQVVERQKKIVKAINKAMHYLAEHRRDDLRAAGFDPDLLVDGADLLKTLSTVAKMVNAKPDR